MIFSFWIPLCIYARTVREKSVSVFDDLVTASQEFSGKQCQVNKQTKELNFKLLHTTIILSLLGTHLVEVRQ